MPLVVIGILALLIWQDVAQLGAGLFILSADEAIRRGEPATAFGAATVGPAFGPGSAPGSRSRGRAVAQAARLIPRPVHRIGPMRRP